VANQKRYSPLGTRGKRRQAKKVGSYLGGFEDEGKILSGVGFGGKGLRTFLGKKSKM